MKRRRASRMAARRTQRLAAAMPRSVLLDALRRTAPVALDRATWAVLLDAWAEDLADAAICVGALAEAEARCVGEARRLAESEALREEAWNEIALRDGRLAALAAGRHPDNAPSLRRAAPTILILVADVTVGGATRLLGELFRWLPDWRFVVATTAPVGPDTREAWDWLPTVNTAPHPRPTDVDDTAWAHCIRDLVHEYSIDAVCLVNNALGYRLLAELRGRFPRLALVDYLLGRAGPVYDHWRHRPLIDATIVESVEMRSFLAAHGDDDTRIHVVASGIDVAPHAAARAAAPPRRNFVVGFSGRMSEEKNPLGFVALAERLRGRADIHFVMTGGGPLVTAVERAIAERDLEERLHYAGLVDDVSPWLAGYDTLVLPSREDGRPQVVLEAFAMGVPVVVSRVGGLAELVRDGDTGFLCDPWDIDAFARAVTHLADQPGECRAMGERARRFAATELDPESMARDYAAAFLSLPNFRRGDGP